MTATCVFVFCSAIVMDVEMILLNKIDGYSAKVSYEAESHTCPDNITCVDLIYIDILL